jgi:hypothetical protein
MTTRLLRLSGPISPDPRSDSLNGYSISAGAFPMVKMLTPIFGMVTGSDYVDDMHRLQHGATARAFGAVRAPSTLGGYS